MGGGGLGLGLRVWGLGLTHPMLQKHCMICIWRPSAVKAKVIFVWPKGLYGQPQTGNPKNKVGIL